MHGKSTDLVIPKFVEENPPGRETANAEVRTRMRHLYAFPAERVSVGLPKPSGRFLDIS